MLADLTEVEGSLARGALTKQSCLPSSATNSVLARLLHSHQSGVLPLQPTLIHLGCDPEMALDPLPRRRSPVLNAVVIGFAG
jgi:hypothetical protein